MSRILHKSFKYTPAAATDVGKTFRRIRAELKANAERESRNAAEAEAKVQSLEARAKKAGK